MGVLIDESGSHKKFSRSGNPKRHRVAVNQCLYVGRNYGGTFIAVLRDPETGGVIHEAALCHVQAGESVDLLIECLKDEEKVGIE